MIEVFFVNFLFISYIFFHFILLAYQPPKNSQSASPVQHICESGIQRETD